VRFRARSNVCDSECVYRGGSDRGAHSTKKVMMRYEEQKVVVAAKKDAPNNGDRS
jgi:hypothetical protein